MSDWAHQTVLLGAEIERLRDALAERDAVIVDLVCELEEYAIGVDDRGMEFDCTICAADMRYQGDTDRIEHKPDCILSRARKLLDAAE